MAKNKRIKRTAWIGLDVSSSDGHAPFFSKEIKSKVKPGYRSKG